MIEAKFLFFSSPRKENQKFIVKKWFILILEKLLSWHDRLTGMKNYKGEKPCILYEREVIL